MSQSNDATEPLAEGTPENPAAGKPAPEPVRKSCSPGLTAWMRRNRVSIAFTSYQSGRLYLLGSDPTGRLSFHERIYQRAMGVVGNGQRLFMGGLYQIWRFENILNDGQLANNMFENAETLTNGVHGHVTTLAIGPIAFQVLTVRATPAVPANATAAASG